MRKRGFLAAALGMIAAVMLVTGCATKATGGGFIPSVTIGQTATFGFSWDATDCADPLATSCIVRFNGSYHDPAGMIAATPGTTVSVSLKGAGKLVRVPPPPNVPGVTNCMNDPVAPYTSQEAAFPGSGTLDLTMCDFGQGQQFAPSTGDFLQIRVNTGPFTGYENAQLLQGGNIQAS